MVAKKSRSEAPPKKRVVVLSDATNWEEMSEDEKDKEAKRVYEALVAGLEL